MSDHPLNRSTAGLTLVEMIVVLMIISILALIAAPSWLAFANSRRAEAGRDQVFQILRQAQSQAIQTRQAQVVNFVTPANELPIVKTGGISQRLDGQIPDESLNGKMMGLQILNGDSGSCSADAQGCIAFDDRGNIKRDDSTLGEEGIKVVVTSPVQNGNKRCVIVRTLLGAMQTGSDDECE
jgi:prepilin-type N-terminal cleavage/methylation domain-containing protein